MGRSVAAPTPDGVKPWILLSSILSPIKSTDLAFPTVAWITGSWPSAYGFKMSQAVFVNVLVADARRHNPTLGAFPFRSEGLVYQ